MARNVRPAKPMAVLSAVVGVGILIVGIIAMASSDESPPIPFVVLWIVAGVGIVGFNLWSAFGKGGHIYRIEDR